MTIRLGMLLWLLGAALVAAADGTRPARELPPAATTILAESLEDAERHERHVWRDTPPFAGDGLVHAYVEVPRGERRKWEFDMSGNARELDRMIPEEIGGYPVNYGFVPQTVSYDGDPFDALVLGPPLGGGQVVRGVIVGLMLMEDEKGPDAKVVLSPVGAGGRPLHALDDGERERLRKYFSTYKRLDPGKFSEVSGWGSPEDGRAFVVTTHAFFRECRERAGEPCRLQP